MDLVPLWLMASSSRRRAQGRPGPSPVGRRIHPQAAVYTAGTAAQREVLERAKTLVVDRTQSLIPDRYSWAAWRQHDYYIVRSCGISREDGITSHGLRHEYLQNLYKEQTGVEPPINGGAPGQIPADLEKAARQEVAEQAGHSRPSISTHDLGRQR